MSKRNGERPKDIVRKYYPKAFRRRVLRHPYLTYVHQIIDGSGPLLVVLGEGESPVDAWSSATAQCLATELTK